VAALPAVLALGLVACGDDDDTPETVPASSETEATGGGDVTLPGGSTLPDISLPDISLPDISLPDISVPDLSDISVPEGLIEDALRNVLPDLSDEQISCLADGLETDFDLQRVQELAESCDIDLADVQLGG
jgi:hypothetical protein